MKTTNKMFYCCLLLVVFSFITNSRLITKVVAQEDTQALDDLVEKFDDNKQLDYNETPLDKTPFIQFDGFAKIGTAYNYNEQDPVPGGTDWQGFSRLRGELQLESRINFSKSWFGFVSGKGYYDFIYRINGHDEYTDEVIDDYEKELELRDTYISGTISKYCDIKFGRQIIVWGVADNIRITDMLNPTDNRVPGLTDVEDTRIPLTMTRLGLYYGRLSLTGIAIHEIKPNKIPKYGSDFYPFSGPLPEEDIPESNLSNTEYALAFNGRFEGWDIAFYWANVYKDSFYTEIQDDGSRELKYPRLNSFGFATAMVFDTLILKAEAATIYGIKYMATGDKKFRRTDMLVGLEYTGIEDTNISIEAADRHLHKIDERLEGDPHHATSNHYVGFLRVQRSFFHQTLDLTATVGVNGLRGQLGRYERYTLDYDLIDDFTLTLGLMLYQSAEHGEYSVIGPNDRVFCELKYSF